MRGPISLQRSERIGRRERLVDDEIALQAFDDVGALGAENGDFGPLGTLA